MATRPGQLLRLVAQLRADHPGLEYRQALRIAAFTIEAHREPEVLNVEASPPRPSFRSMALDRAFRDGGWGVLDYERRHGMLFGDDLTDDQYGVGDRLRRLMRRS